MKSSDWRVLHPHGLASMLTLGPALISSSLPLWGVRVEGIFRTAGPSGLCDLPIPATH